MLYQFSNLKNSYDLELFQTFSKVLRVFFTVILVSFYRKVLTSQRATVFPLIRDKN